MSIAVGDVVTEIIDAVRARGDEALREYSSRLDSWEPESFRLSDDERERLVASVPAEVIEDTRFARTRCAASRRRSGDGLGHRGRDAAGREARPQNIPVQQRRLLRARRAISDGRLGAHEHRHRQGRRGPARRRVHAADERRPPPPRWLPCTWRRRRDLHLGGVQAVAAMALGTETIAPVDMLVVPATPTSPKRSASCSAGWASTCLPARPKCWSIADERADAEMVATDLLGQAEHGPTSPAILITTSRASSPRRSSEVERQLDGAADRRRRRRRPGATTAEIILVDERGRGGRRGRPARKRARRGADRAIRANSSSG